MNIITLIIEIFKFINMLLPELINLIKVLVGKHLAAEKRIADAEAARIASELKAQTEQARKEQANLKAFQFLLKEVWRDRHDRILNFIKLGQEENVLILTEQVDNDEVDNVLFHSDNLSPEIKALRIIEIMRKREDNVTPNR